MFKIKLNSIIYLLLYALTNTILSFGILHIINSTLSGNEDFLKGYMGLVFTALIVYTYLLNIIFQKKLNRFTFKFLYDYEKTVFAQILRAPLRKLEKLGSNRFYTTVEDLRAFSILPTVVTHTVNSALMLLLCLAYMFSISVVSALLVIVLISLVAGCYLIMINSMSKRVARLREYDDEYYAYVEDVIKGFKELKLNFFRRENLLNRFLIPNRNSAEGLAFNLNYVFLSINLISQYGLYFVIGTILFLLPELGLLSRSDVIAYVVIILFISGPINTLINFQQSYTDLLVANKRIKKFMADFNAPKDSREHNVLKEAVFESLMLKEVSFTYRDENNADTTFDLGPLNLEIGKGEVVFIVGGNGSGKSTFINLLTGLYKPTEGEIILNHKTGEDARLKMQEMIAAVFTDNHIFSKNYDSYELENNLTYSKLLKIMKLSEVIVDDKDNSARRKLSKGQSKRMSLIFALLEEKPILLLDEWAADQDPYFRKYFYEELIPKLRRENKTIIAVTHDDAYFHLADRIIKFDLGKIVKDFRVQDRKMFSEEFWT